MTNHIPNKGEQMVRYYGYYSNVSRGRRQKAKTDAIIPCMLQPELTDVQFRKSWSRLIQKIYEVDPLVCPKCRGEMRVVAFIEDPDVSKNTQTPEFVEIQTVSKACRPRPAHNTTPHIR